MLVIKDLPANRRPRFYSWVGKIPWRRKWQPIPGFLLWKSHGQRSLVGYSPWGPKESDTAEWLSLFKFFPSGSFTLPADLHVTLAFDSKSWEWQWQTEVSEGPAIHPNSISQSTSPLGSHPQDPPRLLTTCVGNTAQGVLWETFLKQIFV